MGSTAIIKTLYVIGSYLNKWFEGRVIFEVDRYYTLRPLTEEGFIGGRESWGEHTYSTDGRLIEEGSPASCNKYNRMVSSILYPADQLSPCHL